MLSLLLASLLGPALVPPPSHIAAQEVRPAVQLRADLHADEFARLVPSEACVVVRVRSLQNIYDSVREVMRGVDPSVDLGSIQSWIDRLDLPADAAHIALDRPIGMALTIGADGTSTTTLIVPASDTAALSASIHDPRPNSHVITSGGYVVISDLAGYTINADASPIASSMSAGDIAVRVDLGRLIALFGPVIDQTLASAEQAFAAGAESQPGALYFAPILSRYITWARTLVSSAEMLDVGATNEAGMLTFSGTLTCRTGSAMATWLGGNKIDIARAARLLDPNATLQYAFAGDMPKLAAAGTSMFAAIADNAPEDMREALGGALHDLESLAAQLGTSIVMNGDWTDDGLRGCAYVHASKPAELLASYVALLDNDVFARCGIQVQIGPDIELAGAKWTQARMQFDAEAWTKWLAPDLGEDVEQDEDDVEPQEHPAPDMEALQQAIDHMYGAQGLQAALTIKGDQLVVLFGADEARAKAALARVDAKPTGDALASALGPALGPVLAQVNQTNGAVVMRCDYGVAIERMLGMMRGVLGDAPGLLDSFKGLHLPITTWAAVDGRSWKAGLNVRVADVANFAAVIQRGIASQTQRSQVEVDIMMLSSAIDLFLIENGGRAPESLEVLVTPDENGHSFLQGKTSVPLDPWKRPYLYEPPSASRDYRVFTLGRDGKPGGSGEDIDIDNFTLAHGR